MISRADAARVAVALVSPGTPPPRDAVFDAAWQRGFGVSSAGAEETRMKAARQPILRDAYDACE